MKKYLLLSLSIIIAGIIISSVFLWIFLNKESSKNNVIEKKYSENMTENVKKSSISSFSEENKKSIDGTKESSEIGRKEELNLPNFVQNDAPFIVQAPFGIWDELHDEACEEAVVIIANGFLDNIKEISKEKADEEILKLVDWQIEKYGRHKDLNIEEIQELALEFYGDNFEISENVNEESFKKILAEGDIIIIPAAGRELGNPYFTPPGPLYHALVVIGYDETTKEFITNDPGTKRGEEFRYPYKTILQSIHDFPGKKEKILEGKPRVLIVKKQKIH